MAEKFLMPKLSPTMEEGQISRWLKNEGDTFEANETIAEVDTDKATMEMTALAGGMLLKIIKAGGDTALLGEAIAITGESGEDISALLAEIGGNGATNGGAAAKPQEKPVEQPKEAAQAETQTSAAQTSGNETSQKNVTETEGRSYDYQRPDAVEDVAANAQTTERKSDSNNGGRMIVSPIAARMASENNVNLKSIKGSGPGGRIIKRDIETAIGGLPSVVSGQTEEISQSEFSIPQLTGASRFRDENTSKMRQVIASRLAQSIGPIPTFYLTVEIEMDKALEFRKQINASLREDEKVSVNDVVVKVAASALQKHPFANSSYQDKTIRFYEDADIGVAVAVEDGLITPVVRGANRKGIAEIAKEIKEKAARAREKKLQPEEYTGATFSISNLGMFGIEQFTAIINPPEAAILAVGGANPKAVVCDGEIVIRNIMNVTMSCDHRVIDGATGAKFLQTFKQMMENPVLMLM
ncbi:MAG TPA: pyruvate dehydrogenase complex dihydrolipoamide acetyltransferase [Pyrinomonadaceae bacterium]|nr:pyruvate dehydrogenase complex dihydrolipoamide acetyltransferase [Pyrinomonadaceae bacterium]